MVAWSVLVFAQLMTLPAPDAGDAMVAETDAGPVWLAAAPLGFLNEFRALQDGGVDAKPWAVTGKVLPHAPGTVLELAGQVFVTDTDSVFVVNRATGQVVAHARVLGSSSLGGLAAWGGRVFVVDSGWRRATHDGGVVEEEATGTDGVYALDLKANKLVVKTVVKSRELQHPEAVIATAAGLWVASSTTPVVRSFDGSGHSLGPPVPLPCAPRAMAFLPTSGDWLLACPDSVVRGRLGEAWPRVASVAGVRTLACDESLKRCLGFPNGEVIDLSPSPAPDGGGDRR